MGFQNPDLWGGMEFSKIYQSEILSADKILLVGDRKVCFAATLFFVWSYDPWFRIFWLPKLKNLGNRPGEAILAVFTRNQPKSLGDQNWIFDPRAIRNQNSIDWVALQTSFSISLHIPGLPGVIPGLIKSGKIDGHGFEKC